MKNIHPHVRITALALLVVVSLVAGIAGTSALTAPRSGTGASGHGAGQERTTPAAAYPMPLMPQAHIPFVAERAGPAPVSTPIPTAVSVDTVLVPDGNGVDAFRIGRTEVTNAQYALCVVAGICTPPGDTTRYNDPSYADHPVTWVTWGMARTYALWIGGQLPRNVEWMRACQGDDGHTYPWGYQSPDATRANYDNNVGDTTAVGSYPAGASPYGALDMSGNVAEWVEDGIYVVRGGAFRYIADTMTCGARGGSGNDRDEDDVGFRVMFLVP